MLEDKNLVAFGAVSARPCSCKICERNPVNLESEEAAPVSILLGISKKELKRDKICRDESRTLHTTST